MTSSLLNSACTWEVVQVYLWNLALGDTIWNPTALIIGANAARDCSDWKKFLYGYCKAVHILKKYFKKWLPHHKIHHHKTASYWHSQGEQKWNKSWDWVIYLYLEVVPPGQKLTHSVTVVRKTAALPHDQSVPSTGAGLSVLEAWNLSVGLQRNHRLCTYARKVSYLKKAAWCNTAE